jgi:flavin reductase (DIM6/NTAB) family NADH-FMN oxidoreductase RutF
VIFPTPAALVTSIDQKGKSNIATAGEVFMMSLKPLIVAVGFRPSRYSNKLIHATREFVVNLPKEEILEAVDYCGYVKPPLIKECPVNVECRVVDVICLGSHEVFAGEVLTIHADEGVIGEDGLPDLTKFKTIAFASRKYYRVTGLLEKMYFSKDRNADSPIS